MRLIDADSIIESIKNLMENGATIEQAIDAQPTAYDVDSVVEELKCVQVEIFFVEQMIFTDDAIAIVKAGAV